MAEEKRTMCYRQQIEQAGLSKAMIAHELDVSRGALDRWLLKDEVGRLENYKSFCLFTIIKNMTSQKTSGEPAGRCSGLWG